MEPIGGGVEVDHVQLETSAIESTPNIDTDDRVLQIRGNNHLKNSGWVGNGTLKMFEEHEFVQGIVPLHKKDTIGSGTAQIFVTVVGIATNATFATPFCVIHLEKKNEIP